MTEPTVEIPGTVSLYHPGGYELVRIYSALVPQQNAPGIVMKVRVEVHRNFYDFQCRYRSDVLTPNGWRPLHSIPGESTEFKAPSGSSFERYPAECRSFVEAMADRLATESYQILSF